MKDEKVRELLYQALETEIGGVQVYTTLGLKADPALLRQVSLDAGAKIDTGVDG